MIETNMAGLKLSNDGLGELKKSLVNGDVMKFFGDTDEVVEFFYVYMPGLIEEVLAHRNIDTK